MKKSPYLLLCAFALTLLLPAVTMADTKAPVSTEASAYAKRSSIILVSPANGSTVMAGNTLIIAIRRANPRTLVSVSVVSAANPTRSPSYFTMRSSKLAQFSWKIPPTMPAGPYLVIARSNDSSTEVRSQFMVKTAAKPSASETLLQNPAAQVASDQFAIDGVDATQNVPLVDFAIHSSNATTTVRSVTVLFSTASSTVAASRPTVPTTAYLYDKSTNTLLKSKAVSGPGELTFDNLPAGASTSVLPNGTKEYRVAIDMPSNTISGSSVTGYVTRVAVSVPLGAASLKQVVGNPMIFLGASANGNGFANYQQASASNIALSGSDRSGNPTSVVAVFPLTLFALAGNVPAPTNADFKVTFKNVSTGATVPADAIVTSVIPNTPVVAQGSIVSVTVTAQKMTGSLSAGLYSATLTIASSSLTITTASPANVANPKTVGFLSNLKASVIDSMRAIFGIFGF